MTSLTFPLRLGTRASPLALAQAHLVRDALCAAHDWPENAIEIVAMTASGDRIQDRALADVGGKALWTKELDAALDAGNIDFAVHSMKDVETLRPPEFMIAAMLERADPRDRLVGGASVAALPQGARVGTSSPRRSAQLRRKRPDLEILLFRGNVATRLAKLDRGEADATLLAAAGLDRLGFAGLGAAISMKDMLPAPAQGAVGIECLARRDDIGGLIATISHADTFDCVMAERAWLEALGADCHSSVAAHARIDGGRISFSAELLLPDGSECVTGSFACTRGEEFAAAARSAEDMLARASSELRACFAR